MSTLPLEILAPATDGPVLSTLITATTTPTSTTLSSTPTSTTIESSTPTPSKSTAPTSSIIDPPTIAGITVGALAAGVLAFCLVGVLVHWLSERKRAQYRKDYAQAHAEAHTRGRWGPDNDQHPPEADSNALPQPDVFKSYPKMIESPSAGHRVDANKIGMAISENPADDAPGPSNRRDYPNQGSSKMSGGQAYQPYFDYQTHQRNISDQDRPMFQADDGFAPLTAEGQSLPPRDPLSSSALRPRAAPRSTPFRKRSPPPLDIPLNHSGAPPTRILPPPRRERQILARDASNAQAPILKLTNATTPSRHRRKITPEDLMKPLPAPASPEVFAPQLQPLYDDYAFACEDGQGLTRRTLHPPSPPTSATPSSNLEGHTEKPEKLRDNRVPTMLEKKPTASTATRFSTTNSIASRSTTFESLHSDIATPEETATWTTHRVLNLFPLTTPASPTKQHSVHYPHVPRSANEYVPRSRNFITTEDSLAPLPMRTAPLASTIDNDTPQTPLSATSAVYTPHTTSRKRITPKRTNTSPATSGVTLESSTIATAAPIPNASFPPCQSEQVIQHRRNGSSTTITPSPQTHQRGKSTGGTIGTARSGRSGSGSAEMRSTPSTPWSAGCGVIEVALRSPSWSSALARGCAGGLGSPGLGMGVC